MMVAVAILGLGTFVWLEASTQHFRASHRAIAIEGVARALDQELERMRACESSSCLKALATETATRTGVSADAESWIRPEVHRTIQRGPGPGLYQVTVTARVPGVVPERSARAILRVKR